MTPAWAGAAQWRVLDVGVDNSERFLSLWRAWQADPQRPRILHVVCLCQDKFENDAIQTDLKPLAEQLDPQLWGLLPGFHRLVFEAGQVLLTLCIGDLPTVLKQQQFEADEVFLRPAASAKPSAADTLNIVKRIARLCRRDTTFTAPLADLSTNSAAYPDLPAALKQCGFTNNLDQPLDALTPNAVQAVYQPAWARKKEMPAVTPSTCVVIGAGLAGAAVASSLARRGWAVTVLDSASQPASGASSLPAGLLVAHTSPDDGQLSRLSRSGVRLTLQQARAHLKHGTDWGHTGVLQRSLSGETINLPPDWAQTHARAASDWCYPAKPAALTAAGVPLDATALWHAQAGWIKPAALVATWLAAPGVTWRGNAHVEQITPTSDGWRVLDTAGNTLAEADLIVLCAGYASRALVASAGEATQSALPDLPDLQPIRGQVTFGLQSDATRLPPFPVNGNGALIPGITTPNGPLWLMGASYERDIAQPQIKPQDHLENLTRLRSLLPNVADDLASQFLAAEESLNAPQGWSGVRCATPNRLPLVAPLSTRQPAWLCTGMGSRGLSFAALCAELLAARLHAEPLPIDAPLANALQRKAKSSLQNDPN